MKTKDNLAWRMESRQTCLFSYRIGWNLWRRG